MQTPSRKDLMVLASKRVLTGTLAAVVAATGLLAGCDQGSQSRAAAIVDGQPILESDVQTAAREFNGGSSQVTQPVQPANVVSLLTFGRYVLPAVQQSGKGVSDDAARKLLDKVENPSRSTLDFVRTALALNSMDPATEEKVVQQLKQADIELNPRYGSLDRKTLQIGPETRNWLVADAAGAPSPAPTPAPAP